MEYLSGNEQLKENRLVFPKTERRKEKRIERKKWRKEEEKGKERKKVICCAA